MTLFIEPSETRLANGVRIVTERMPATASVSLGIFVGAGARAEAPREHGIAHLLEHMAFKGTGRRSARRIVEEIEAVGGDINAATSFENTAYYARVLSADTGLALDILSDILTDSVVDPAELAREQGVIRQEIAAVLDTPDDLVFEHLQATAFPDQALGRSILGTEESVSAFTQADVRSFLSRHYLGPHTVVAGAGDLDHGEVVARVSDLLGGLPAVEGPPIEPGRFVGGETRDNRKLEQVNVAIGLPGVALGDDRIYAARLFAAVLGGGMASRLFQEVREVRGLCYTVSAFHWAFNDTGMLGVHAASAEKDVPELVPVLFAEVARAADDVDTDEVLRAKAQLKAGLLMSLESSSSRAERLARQVLVYGRPRPIQDVVAAVDRVTVDDVRAFGREAVAAGRAALATVGRVRRLAKLSSFIDIAPPSIAG